MDDNKPDWAGTAIMFVVYLTIWELCVRPIEDLKDFALAVILFGVTNLIHAYIMDYIQNKDDDDHDHHDKLKPTGMA